MKTQTLLVLSLSAALLAGCSSVDLGGVFGGGAPSSGRVGDASSTGSMGAYKTELAQRISAINAGKVYSGRPQALLRSVIVIKYQVDGNGNLGRTDLFRSNGDRTAESTALASLHNSQPFPRPAAHLLKHGRVEVTETWLFNDDGRFQLRTIAQPQMNE